MPGTRIRVLSMLMEWAKDDPMRVFWLAGLAGTGKTSVAITLCRMLQNDPSTLLGGAFFCSRTANIMELTDARCILPTLAMALAEHSSSFAVALAKELDIDPRAALKPASVQAVAFLQRPLSALASLGRPIVFVIDGLDECSDEHEVKRLLQAISTLEGSTIVKFILMSRPEMHISTSPISVSDRNSILRLHTIDTVEVTEDIRLYINNSFSQQPLEETWYSDSDVFVLAARADGLFIFASTVISYILSTGSPNWRRARLHKIMSAVTTAASLGSLDAMYNFVVTRAASTRETDTEELEETKHVLACILSANVPLSVRSLAELLDYEVMDLRESLRRLQAVIHVPDDYDMPGLRTLHVSFNEYLLERAVDRIRIPSSQGDENLARGCLRLMRKQLYFNVSQSHSSYEPNLPATLDIIAHSLRYACMQWVYHIARLSHMPVLEDDIHDVFRPRFLFWLEVMSVLGQVQRAAAMLIIASATVRRIMN